VTLPEDLENLDPGLAAERTMLAWGRTAIAFGAVGGVILRRQPVAGLVVLAMTPLIWALGRFAGRFAGRRVPRPEQLSWRLLLVTVIVVMISALGVALAFLDHGPASLSQLLHGKGR
jgi:uncharacterized membrane protein YidH (DUF202 family)